MTRGPADDHSPARGPGRNGPELSYPKAILLTGVAVVLGVLMLQAASHTAASVPPSTTSTLPPGGTTTSGAAGTSTTGAAGRTTTTGAGGKTTTTTAPATTTTTAAKPSQTVKVVVANASHTNGAATYFTSKLTQLGWGTLTPTSATEVVTASVVYYATGQQASAAAIATELGLKPTAVKPIGGTTPISGQPGEAVAVIIGTDLGPQTTASTTTTTASTTTTTAAR